MNENQKSLVVTGIVLLFMAGSVAALLRSANRRQGPVAAQPAPRVVSPAAPVRAVAAPVAAPKPRDPRTAGVLRRGDFATNMEKRLRRQGRAMTVRATGVGHRTLEFNWTVKADREHMESIKKARPLHEELRGMGFSALEMKVRERQVWLKKL